MSRLRPEEARSAMWRLPAIAFAAAKGVGVVIAIILVLTIAVVAMLAVASMTQAPVLFLGAGLVVLALGIGGLAWLLARHAARRRRIGLTLGSVVVTVVVAGASVAFPLGDPQTPADSVEGMQVTELPTGSRIAWVRLSAVGQATGPPILFVHGGPGASDMAHDLDFFGELAADGHDVILYDEVGTGHSGRLADPSKYSLDRDLADLEALIAELDLEQPILIGHSYGGTLVASYMAKHPDAADRLIFLAPGAIRSGGEQYLGGMRERLTGVQQLRLYAKLLEPRALFGYLVTLVNPRAASAWIGDAEFDARFDILYGLTSPGLACDGSFPLPKPHQLGFFTNTMPRRIPDLRAGLSRVDVPTLILKPQCDYLPWWFGTDLATTIDGSSLVYIRGAGHSIYVEQRDAVLAELRAFIAGQPLPIAPQTNLEPPADLEGPIGDQPPDA